jgi:hypothetical protein
VPPPAEAVAADHVEGAEGAGGSKFHCYSLCCGYFICIKQNKLKEMLFPENEQLIPLFDRARQKALTRFPWAIMGFPLMMTLSIVSLDYEPHRIHDLHQITKWIGVIGSLAYLTLIILSFSLSHKLYIKAQSLQPELDSISDYISFLIKSSDKIRILYTLLAIVFMMLEKRISDDSNGSAFFLLYPFLHSNALNNINNWLENKKSASESVHDIPEH